MKKIIYSLTILMCSHSLVVNAQPFFEDQSTQLGIDEACGDVNLGTGVSFYDFDQDGWDDITLATDSDQQVRFFKNVNGVFVEQVLNITSTLYQSKMVNWVDFDNDGDKDLFVTSDTSGNRLFENTGNLNFQDITLSAGLPTANLKTFGATWGDYNNDGHLDVFICNRDATYTIPNYLYKNNGDGTFTDVSIAAGILSSSDLSFCAAFFDYNNDGWQDIYIANDKYGFENIFYENNGDGTFSEVGFATGTNLSVDAMSVTVGDYNGDGWFDLYVTNSIEGNFFLKNNANGTFVNVANTNGTSFDSIGWGAVFLDADNDRELDLYVSGAPDGSLPQYISAAFYWNTGNGTYQIPATSGFSGDTRESYSNAIGDVDNDGYPEIAVTNVNDDDLFLWKNETSSTNNWLKVKLEGTVSNRDGIGSVIEISVNTKRQYRYTVCGEGYLGQNSGTEIFGLGTNTNVDYVKVTWLSGIEDIFYNVQANQVLEITEGITLSDNDHQAPVFSVYPNPADEVVFIKATEPITSVQVFNSLGQEVIHKLSESNHLDIKVSDLQSGVYFVKVKNNSKEEIKRIVIR